MIGWVLFRADSLGHALSILKRMFWFNFDQNQLYLSYEFVTILLLAIIISFSTAIKYGLKIENFIYSPTHKLKGNFILTMSCIILLLLSLGSVMSSGFNPFIYYRF